MFFKVSTVLVMHSTKFVTVNFGSLSNMSN